MKRISFWLITVALCVAPIARAQDAATQERLDKFAGRMDDLEKAQEALRKQMNDLSRDLANLREQMSKPNTGYATREDLNSLVESIKKVDQKRIDDAEKIQSELLKLRKVLEQSLKEPRRSAASSSRDTGASTASSVPEKAFEYVVRSGDTLDAIVQAYKEKNIKVTVAQILKANPGLVPERMQVGQKIYIPAP